MMADAGSLCFSPTITFRRPTVSYNVKKLGAAGGVMVTSSHNPWNWNGVKFKAKFGGSATPAIMKSIEEELDSRPDWLPPLRTERASMGHPRKSKKWI